MWINLDDNQLNLLRQRAPELHVAITTRDDQQEKFFLAACYHSKDDIEFDPDAVVSQGDDGAFVMAWYWISNDDAGIGEEDDG